MTSIIDDFNLILGNPEHKLHHLALKFKRYTQELYQSGSGQEWLQSLIVFTKAHPMNHAPATEPHLHGRCEMTAFILRVGSDAALQTIPETITTEKPNGQHKQRRKRTSQSGS